MNKAEAMKAMIDGKKIIDTGHRMIHYYVFEDGMFKFVDEKGQKMSAKMPDHGNYEVFLVKKTKTLHGFTTKACMVEFKNPDFKKSQPSFTLKKTKQSYLPIRISWEEVEE